jgi:hypothetical protein
MKKRPITTITISTLRAGQLRAIAAVHGVSVSDLIARFIESEIQKGTIPDELPGFSVTKARNSVKLEIQAVSGVFRSSDVKDAVDGIEEVAHQPIGSYRTRDGKLSNLYGWFYCKTEPNGFFQVRRRGRGVVVELREGRKNVKKTLTPELALSLARIMRATIGR